MTKLVLAIDDDKLVHHIVDEALSRTCKILHAKNGEEGLRLANKYRPDIILLDVEMPGMSGFEVCEQLKKQSETADIPVMFLSSRTDISERMRGYNAGAADYIVKPFNAEELLARINVLDDYRKTSSKLKQDVQRAQTTAEIAMTDSGDMGRIMRYVGQSYHAHDLSTLSSYFLEFFIPMELDVAVAFWYRQSATFYSSEGVIQPIEQELFEKHKNGSRFVDFGRRTIINYPKVSLLIKNMPVDDAGVYGRYKDLFPHILEATDAKIKDMEVSEDALTKVEHIGQVFAELSDHLSGVGNHYSGKVAEFQSLIQSEQLTALQPQERERLQELYKHFTYLSDELTIIKYKLGEVTEMRQQLIESLNKIAKPWDEGEVASQVDIELF
ncbi:response regulator [Pseudoalteromonas sp. McH1-7]|uniref:Response regulatory domain-containing protein n=1 Tax=Pseudoalteromonas peptidolytica F12-50-A1 TaxID=1315280 RepID=A0A8I0MT66_9GAMM|nr:MULTISPECIES: response regulator [Pseudoalteromonas]MBE0344993.1 hypothetical protein [Pseudoalteromonas peptidolytica F12-50-A1]NLR15600.1 response regulator [Pseudoalteromonas peptidolytica]NUZ11872.1 response regulator [Pseudoalteromonas sp. McH1-7]RRS09870.1 response regulator [Pseudoalteromonas sp. J010]GEK08284.1 hypothetical protein PPE03_05330 [Pseudoalteromonas peptidolytica]